MFQLINNILHEFRNCFKRKNTWHWFLVLVFGFMIHSGKRGITGIISALRLQPRLYHTILHFFRSTAYEVGELYDKWIKTAVKYSEIVRIAGRVVLLGDHCKVSKEGRRMPDVEMLHQQSQNSGKPEYIAGHNYGQIAMVITNGKYNRAMPLMTELQKSPPKKEGTKKPDGDTLVVQMVNLAHTTAKSIGEPVVVALDAYFSSEPAWTAADKTINDNGIKTVEIVTRAQKNTVAYTLPEQPAASRRGRPRVYGTKIALNSLFSDMSQFIQTEMVLYGKKTTVKYLCLDLLWKPVKKLVRFVLVESGSGRCVLMSSSLTLTAEEIITIYALRFKIETAFDEQKNDIGCFDYRFWTSAQPKFKKWRKHDLPEDDKSKSKINDARKAVKSFVCLTTIAAGLLTIIAFSHNRDIWNRYPGWIRTRRSEIPTASIVKDTISQDFYEFSPRFYFLPIFKLILPLRRISLFLYQDVA